MTPFNIKFRRGAARGQRSMCLNNEEKSLRKSRRSFRMFSVKVGVTWSIHFVNIHGV